MTFATPTPRRTRSKAQLARVFLAADGVCHICGQRIRDGERWQADHVEALALGGADDSANLKPAHVRCHAGKSGDDLRAVHKRNRTITRGARPPSRFRKPPPGYVYDWNRRGYVKSNTTGEA